MADSPVPRIPAARIAPDACSSPAARASSAQRVRPRRPRPPRRHPDHGPRQADLRGQPGQPRRRSRPIRSWPRGTASSQGDIADPDVVGPLVAEADAVVNFAAEIARRPVASSTPRRSCGPASSGSTSCSRRSAESEAPCRRTRRRSRFLQVSTDEVYGVGRRGPLDRDRCARAALAVRGGARRPGELLVHSYVVDPRRRRGRDPRLEHLRAVPPPREARSRCS